MSKFSKFDGVKDIQGKLLAVEADLKSATEMLIVREHMQPILDEIAKESDEEDDKRETTGYLKETGELVLKSQQLEQEAKDIKKYIQEKYY